MVGIRDILPASAQTFPDHVAVRAAGEEIGYRELDRLANRVAHGLRSLGVTHGDRVGIWLEKGIPSIAAMQGVLRLGAAYVPVDPMSPASRAATILEDCAVRAVVTTSSRLGAAEFAQGPLATTPRLLADGEEPQPGPPVVRWDALDAFPSTPVDDVPPAMDDDLAYILYTSGSTGKPKGVCISNANARAFIEWAAAEVGAGPTDRMSNHAPFHFDLSVFDLYAAFLSGARVCILPESSSYSPERLVRFAKEEGITIWYSVPSALIMMMQSGGLLEADGLSLRVIVFAGEPFPMRHLRVLHQRVHPAVRLLNWYGPTETNVCTAYEVGALPESWSRPVPIGRASCGDLAWAVRADGETAGVGEEGELFISGPTVMLGYWGREPQGTRPYPTGDLVRVLEDGGFEYMGRRDHMVKVRGHRVELGEIEACLLTHPAIRDAAVVVSGSGLEARLVAFLVTEGGDRPPSLLQIKKLCAERLPRYMIVDVTHRIDALPRTRNGKVDRLALTATANEGGPA